ncbi:kinase-like domain-containing protein [Tuber borchii]|uniref:Kinase-like domain-containing protein n=1 Tax=Tuber borchii TaxID=42251 RepID=A0A2T6ZE86_TUBBO|nr:kinase-like domain-containing protein [Tuber borchii]
MDEAQSDSTPPRILRTEFFQDHVRQTIYAEKAKNQNETMKEEWSNCGELGRGGFGVVYEQIQKATGHYRAVKTIDKRLALPLDYSREQLVMVKLAKHPSLFVEFLGSFEEPETLYIAMEYFQEGDLTKHISTPLSQWTVQNISRQILEGLKVMHQEGITHRDVKPEFLCLPSTTTLHTQVSTPLYGAPEVQGLDSNSETSIYTNSVDIWSLGCVIYELLGGTKLFLSGHQVSCYLIRKQPFLEERLRQLPIPTEDAGTSLLKSMLSIQPQDRPTAADALNHVWLAGITGGYEHEGQKPPSREEITPRRQRKNTPAPHDGLEKKRREGGPPTGDGAGCMTGDVGSWVNPRSQGGRELSPPKLQLAVQ